MSSFTSRTPIDSLHGHIGTEVTVCGWVHGRRDHGKLIFLDLRDATGVVQAVALPSHSEAREAADAVRGEYVVQVAAKVNKRPEKMVNADEANGDIELSCSR